MLAIETSYKNVNYYFAICMLLAERRLSLHWRTLDIGFNFRA